MVAAPNYWFGGIAIISVTMFVDYAIDRWSAFKTKIKPKKYENQ